MRFWKESFLERVKALPMRCFAQKLSDVIRSLELFKIDVKIFVFIKAPRIENIINARQHILNDMSSAFYKFRAYFIRYLYCLES